jgi:hypothetical protein
LVRPSAISANYFALARGQCLDAAVGACGSDEFNNHFRVQCRGALAHPAQGLEEFIHIQHPVLEQVGEVPAGDQPCGVSGFHVLGQQHDAHPGVLAAQQHRRTRPVVGEVRGHAHVADQHVRFQCPRPRQCGRDIPDRGNHLVSRVFQKVREPLAK